MCSLPIMADVVCLLGSSGVPADGFRFFFYGRWADGKLCWSAQIPALEPRRRPQRVLGFSALRLELSLQRLWGVKWSLCETPEP